jgi:hypothetical protein
VLLSIVMDLPLLAPTAIGLTRRPRSESLDVDGVPVEFTCPAGRGPWPTFVFVTGAHPLRRKEPVVQIQRNLKVAFVPLLIGSYAPDMFTKWFVYGVHIGPWDLKASNPAQFHRGCAHDGPRRRARRDPSFEGQRPL